MKLQHEEAALLRLLEDRISDYTRAHIEELLRMVRADIECEVLKIIGKGA